MTLAELLIDAHADMNKIDEDGQTELHHAVQYGRTEMAKLLIRKGAVTNVIDKDGDSPLKIAAQKSMYTALRQDQNGKIKRRKLHLYFR